VFGRQLLVSRVIAQRWPAATVAEQLGVSRATVYKWVRRYRAEGGSGLLDRSCRPQRSPRRLRDDQVAAILRARTRRRYGPHRLAPLTGHPPSTIYHALRRAGMSRLAHADRLTAAPVRYVACHPGALLHVDHKKLGRVPVGGGHRKLGRERRRHDLDGRVGYDHFEVFVDDASRLAAVIQVPDETGRSAAQALELAAAEFAAAGIRLERVLTDNGAGYRSRAFAAVLDRLGARHRWTGPTGRRPTARPNASFAPCSTSGPMSASTAPTSSGWRPYPATSTSTIDVVLTRPSEVSSPRRLSTTS
jgi:transposase